MRGRSASSTVSRWSSGRLLWVGGLRGAAAEAELRRIVPNAVQVRMSEHGLRSSALVRFSTASEACDARDRIDKMVLGGRVLQARLWAAHADLLIECAASLPLSRLAQALRSHGDLRGPLVVRNGVSCAEAARRGRQADTAGALAGCAGAHAAPHVGRPAAGAAELGLIRGGSHARPDPGHARVEAEACPRNSTVSARCRGGRRLLSRAPCWPRG